MASSRENGVNMLDVKKQNRGSILKLIHENDGMSRKDIANRLGLTPAAITMITGEFLEEGLIAQRTMAQGAMAKMATVQKATAKMATAKKMAVDKGANRKGRREVLLQIRGEHYAALGVYITRHKFRLLCVDLGNNTLFEELVYTGDCKRKAYAILDKLTEIIRQKLQEYDVLRSRRIVGLGVSINGIVDSMNGVSVNPFQVWEERDVPVASILEEKLEIPVLLTNNICSLTHGESILGGQERGQAGSMLFIKYGPGLGAAHSLGNAPTSVFNYKAIQLGHVISEPNGVPCVCGNRGCLETIIHYDSIENTVKSMLGKTRTPILWESSGGDEAKINMQEIINAYDAGEKVVQQTLDRVVFYLCLTIKDGLTLFDPEMVVLYGELFENHNFREAVKAELSRYPNTDRVSFSHYNMRLETFGPAATIIRLFFENGGMLSTKAEPDAPE